MNKKEGAVLLAAAAMSVSLYAYGQSKENIILKNSELYKIIRVVDGDTVEISVPYLPEPFKKTLKLRIDGVDTPEKSYLAKCAKERKLALVAKQFTEDSIKKAKVATVILKGWGKYGGRVIGDIVLDGEKLSKKLVDNGLAKVYIGGKGPKFKWCSKVKI